ncbi:CD63 antigen-like [Onthophagus taurus]|uniref:CD63 antigen-like n=1 Tax=Onthophagus taurus TaxID=166361 RepID=UPI000C20ABCB|nr:CD63 antigen-like [Onthophagus taurus]
MGSGGMNCVKYLLFCFNLLFAVSGIAILTVGAIIHTVYHHYSRFVDPTFESAPIFFIIVGVIVFVVAFFGCCGAVRENHCMVITFSVLILLIFGLEAIVGIAGYIRRNDVESMLENRLNESMYNYFNQSGVEKSWNILQHEMKCCGMNGPSDWRQITQNNTLPHTCCPDTVNDGTCTINSLNVYKASCLEELKDTIVTYGALIGGVGIGVALVQIIGVIFACCLARSIRKEYETV